MSEGGGLYGDRSPSARQREAFTAGEVPVAVYGLGKMGLPLAGVYAETAGAVIGVDVDPSVVETIEAGDCHVTGEPGLPELVAEQVERGRLEATVDGPAAAERAGVHVVIVPTLVADGDPDLSVIEAVLDDIAAGLSPGDTVIVESTVPPGTCRDLVRPHLAARSGLDPEAFGVAFCPERTASGRALKDIHGAYPKVVGGVDEESSRVAALIYDELSHDEVHVVSDATTAEAVKVFEGVYRDVNIALANELARLGDDIGISVREAIAAANGTPFCDLHDPGPGVGGHCIPYYPYFLFTRTEEPMALTRTGREVNDEMPAVAVETLARELETDGTTLEDGSILVLGVTYRPGVEETRASPAIDVIDRLDERGADVAAADPLVDPGEYGARPVDLAAVSTREFDGVILVTPHEEFDRIDWDALPRTVVLDGRDALSLEDTHHRVVTLGGTRDGRPRVLDDGTGQEGTVSLADLRNRDENPAPATPSRTDD